MQFFTTTINPRFLNLQNLRSGYRYSYSGIETDHEVSGHGNSYTTQFRQYDPRLGRWKSLDPLASEYPDQSPFAAFNNNPEYFIDPLGLEGKGNGGKSKKEKGASNNGSETKGSSGDVASNDVDDITVNTPDTKTWNDGMGYTVVTPEKTPKTSKMDKTRSNQPVVNQDTEPWTNGRQGVTPGGTKYIIEDFDNMESEPSANDVEIFLKVEEQFEDHIDDFVNSVQGLGPKEIYEKSVEFTKDFPSMSIGDGTYLEGDKYHVTLRNAEASPWSRNTYLPSHGKQNVIMETGETVFKKTPGLFGGYHTTSHSEQKKTNSNISESAVIESFSALIYIDTGNGTSIQLFVTFVQVVRM